MEKIDHYKVHVMDILDNYDIVAFPQSHFPLGSRIAMFCSPGLSNWSVINYWYMYSWAIHYEVHTEGRDQAQVEACRWGQLLVDVHTEN